MKCLGSIWFRVGVVIVVIAASCWLFVWGSAHIEVRSSSLITAYAALLASFVALFGERLRGWMCPPQLTVDYVHGDDYCDTPVFREAVNGQPIAADCYYFSLRVSNVGRTSAKAVEIMATDLRQRTNRSLLHRFSLNLKWAYLGTPRLATLAPKMDRFCNIGHIIDPAQRSHFANEDIPGVSKQTAIFSLDLEATPNHGIHLLQPGQYQLTIVIAAGNHKPFSRTLDIDVKGVWVAKNLQAMLQQGIVIALS